MLALPHLPTTRRDMDLKKVVELTGVFQNTVYNWGRRLRGTGLVSRGNGVGTPLEFEPAFAVLMLARKDLRTQVPLEPAVIAKAVTLWIDGLDVDGIGQFLGKDVSSIGLQNLEREEVKELLHNA